MCGFKGLNYFILVRVVSCLSNSKELVVWSFRFRSPCTPESQERSSVFAVFLSLLSGVYRSHSLLPWVWHSNTPRPLRLLRVLCLTLPSGPGFFHQLHHMYSPPTACSPRHGCRGAGCAGLLWITIKQEIVCPLDFVKLLIGLNGMCNVKWSVISSVEWSPVCATLKELLENTWTWREREGERFTWTPKPRAQVNSLPFLLSFLSGTCLLCSFLYLTLDTPVITSCSVQMPESGQLSWNWCWGGS